MGALAYPSPGPTAPIQPWNPYGQPLRLPRPANDNYKLPIPANDNVPSLPRRPSLKEPIGLLGRRLAGAVPILGYAFTAYELWRLFSDFENVPLPSGWELWKPICGGPQHFWAAYNLQTCGRYAIQPLWHGGAPIPVYIAGWGSGYVIETFKDEGMQGPQARWARPSDLYRSRLSKIDTYQRVDPAPYAPQIWDLMPQLAPQFYPPPNTPLPPPLPVPWIVAPYLPDFDPWTFEPVRGNRPGVRRRPDPAPTERPGAEPAPEPEPLPEGMPLAPPVPAPSPLPWSPPYARPAQRVTLSPYAEPEYNPRARHTLRPPTTTRDGGREQERKLRPTSRAAGNLLWWSINQVTEACDLVGALYKALPAEVRRPYERKASARGKYSNWLRYQQNGSWMRQRENAVLGCHQQAAIVVKHFKDLPIDQAMYNVMWEQLTDFVYGTLSQGTNPISRRVGRGIELGGWDSPTPSPF